MLYKRKPLLEHADRLLEFEFWRANEAAVEGPTRESRLKHRPLIEAKQETTFRIGKIIILTDVEFDCACPCHMCRFRVCNTALLVGYPTGSRFGEEHCEEGLISRCLCLC